MPDIPSRHELVSRRAMLKRSLAVGTIALVPGLACSSGGKDALATAASSLTTTTGGAKPTTTAASGTGAPATTAAAGTASTTTKAAAASGPALPATAQLKIDFTYTAATGGGRFHNPYIAVWLEDASGALVRTVSLWYKAAEAKYTQELRRWYTDDRARIAKGGADTRTTISGPTRVPGSYSVVWDGKTDTGTQAPQGAYFVCIEAAREQGPYELIRDSITLGTAGLTKALTPNGELSAAAVTFVV